MSDVMRRATAAFNAHDNACPMAEHIRKNKDLTETLVTRRVGLIPEAITTTFHTILSEYVSDYNNQIKIAPDGTYHLGHLPALRTNCVRLGFKCRISDRSVRNHIDRLIDLKFLTKEFHGSKKAFELWINPEILFGETEISDSKKAQNAPKNALFGENQKNFPHICTYVKPLEKEKGSADMLKNQHGFNLYGENNYGEAGEADSSVQPVDDADTERREEIGGGGEILSREQIAARNDQERRAKATKMLDARKPQMPKGLKQKHIEYLLEFWIHALRVLYTGREFSVEQKTKAIAAICAGVYNNFEDERNDQQWVDFQVHQLSKLDKAGRYYDNNPGAYKCDPYAVFVPGKGYFDNANTNGFIGIEGWIKKDSERLAINRSAHTTKRELAKQTRCERLLRMARRDFENLRAGTKLRIEVQYMNQLALFKFYNTVFAGMGQDWQEKFCNQYLYQQSIDFAKPQFAKPRRQQELARRKQASHVSTAVVQLIDELKDWNYDGYGYDVD